MMPAGIAPVLQMVDTFITEVPAAAVTLPETRPRLPSEQLQRFVFLATPITGLGFEHFTPPRRLISLHLGIIYYSDIQLT